MQPGAAHYFWGPDQTSNILILVLVIDGNV